jgi:putative mRNA 3-end processing factor
MPRRAEEWVHPRPEGLFVAPAGVFIDPHRAVDRALVTHGHSDHARPGNRAVLATAETLAIMRARHGEAAGGVLEPAAWGETIRIGAVDIRFVPAGHVLGSAQIVLEHEGCRVVVSGDYKRRPDPTCRPFEPVACDVFVTEATFALPVFRHPPDDREIGRLLHSLSVFPERAHLVGAYALGKCQRVIALLRRAGYDRPIYLHGAMQALCALYQDLGVPLGDLRPVAGVAKADLAGAIVLGPTAATADRWSRRLPDPVIAAASGWMRVRQRARQSGVELPLVISDHADWDELVDTMVAVGAGEIWITHGREEALAHQAHLLGLRARALSLVGYEDEAE